eukprot:227833-Chlamydomonas_euryale.AAC.8
MAPLPAARTNKPRGHASTSDANSLSGGGDVSNGGEGEQPAAVAFEGASLGDAAVAGGAASAAPPVAIAAAIAALDGQPRGRRRGRQRIAAQIAAEGSHDHAALQALSGLSVQQTLGALEADPFGEEVGTGAGGGRVGTDAFAPAAGDFTGMLARVAPPPTTAGELGEAGSVMRAPIFIWRDSPLSAHAHRSRARPQLRCSCCGFGSEVPRIQAGGRTTVLQQCSSEKRCSLDTGPIHCAAVAAVDLSPAAHRPLVMPREKARLSKLSKV